MVSPSSVLFAGAIYRLLPLANGRCKGVLPARRPAAKLIHCQAMPAGASTPSRALQRRKQLRFRIAAVLLSLVAAFAITELFLRWRDHRILASGVYDPPNLFRYDADLGWALTPGWQGTHAHYDYRTHYTINELGFREDASLPAQRRGPLHAVVGDSFTFGLGVADTETFVRLLNAAGTNSYVNFSIPGYSTDQETLLIEQEVLRFKPEVVDLVVYLGNDLFDNQLPFPIQASRGKPYAELSPAGLVVKNIPVPLRTKSDGEAAVTLESLVRAGEDNRNNLRGRLEQSSATFALLIEQVFPRRLDERSFAGKFDSQLDLFFALADRIRTNCAAKGASLNLILMAGKSYVENPESESAQFQDYLRAQVAIRAGKLGFKVTDLAQALRQTYANSPRKWFYPNEGHLTPAGHKVVAQILAGKLD